MQNEVEYFYQYNEFLQNVDFEKLFLKNGYAILVYEVLKNNILL